VGIGATVSNGLTVCGDCMIGAGAVVVKNIDAPGTYVGVPARRMT
jgi:acetyltransferase-like isoleucine patch superfamily enzyme